MGIVIGIGLLLLAGGGIAVAVESSHAQALQAQVAEAQAAARAAEAAARAADAAARARQTEALMIAMRNSQRLTTLLMLVVILLAVALLAMIAVWLYTNMQRNREEAFPYEYAEPSLSSPWEVYYMMLRQKLSRRELPPSTIVATDDPFWILGVYKDEEVY